MSRACSPHFAWPRWLALTVLAWGLLVFPRAQGQELARWIDHLEQLVPVDARRFSAKLPADVAAATTAIEQWAVLVSAQPAVADNSTVVAQVKALLDAKRRCDLLLDRTLSVRTQFASLKSAPEVRDWIRSFLPTTAELIDLSGRLRYLLSDVLSTVVPHMTSSSDRERLLDLAAEYQSSIGAHVAAKRLLVSLASDARGNEPAERMTLKLLALLGRCGPRTLLPDLVQLLEGSDATPAVRLAAVEAICQIGLPQEPRANSPPEIPQPAITPKHLHALLSQLDGSQLPPALAERRKALLALLEARGRQGLAEDRYSLGAYEVQPGDWILMRNPSPYNLFTDLSPGLFTHVGVVTTEPGKDGIRRMVVVDLQETGHRMPATNVELFIERSLHFVFLRHPDAKVAAQMAEAARSMIGNEKEFDLNFRTARVLELAHQPLAGRKITTYCAGFLLLCALQTDAPREDFFPIHELPAAGRTAENLRQLGMGLGNDFISPTGALFSPKLHLIGSREPMYDPQREIEEAVFDHFADSLVSKEIKPAPDLFDSLRLKVAEASRSNPALARALAKAAGVAEDTDLVAAARGAAVVETLDDVAYSASGEFERAREALRAAPAGGLASRGMASAEVAMMARFQTRHYQLYGQVQSGQLSPRQLRVILVQEYSRRGREEIDQRFFSGPPSKKEPAASSGK